MRHRSAPCQLLPEAAAADSDFGLRASFGFRISVFGFLALLSTFLFQPSTAQAQGTAFTYQGRLNSGGSPANGNYDFRFRLASDAFANNYVGGNVFTNDVPITNGLFMATLDFGAVFSGSNYWLEVSVRTNGVGLYTTLNPLQPLTPAPYAIFAEGASNVLGVIPSGGLSGSYPGPVNFGNSGNSFSGSFSGNGSGITNVNAGSLGGIPANGFWSATGNGGTTAGVNFLGTTDNQPIELHVNGLRALRLENAPNDDSNISNAVNVIAGSHANFVRPDVKGATIAGGGADFYFGGGVANAVAENYGTIGGGIGNNIMSNAWESTIAGGNANTLYPGAYRSVIAGGWFNSAGTNANHSFIGGGVYNRIEGTNIAAGCVIAGGGGNDIQASSNYDGFFGFNVSGATIGGGFHNSIPAGSIYNTIAGGVNNVAASSWSTVGGGDRNNASYVGTTVAGGQGNVASYFYGTVGGGLGDTASGYATTVSGGYQNTGAGWYSTLGGGQYNTNGQYASYATIGGGYNNNTISIYEFIGGGENNSVGYVADHSAIGGGFNNVVGGTPNAPQYGASDSFIGGGYSNTLDAACSVLVGGSNNVVQSTAFEAFIGGGTGNSAAGTATVVAGGYGNSTTGNYATVGGGYQNVAGGTYSTVAGGTANTAGGNYCTVSGGFDNSATGTGATAAGGIGDVASGPSSFAAGTFAQAAHDGAFVWGDDSTSTPVASAANNSVTFRAAGGYRLFSNSGMTLGVSLAASGTSWSTISDRNAKKNFAPVDGESILETLARIPIERWNYKSEKDGDTPNIGPMAQDFKAAFYPGRDDKSISTLEFDGVELAAIQGLNRKLEVRSEKLEAENAELKARLERLEERFEAKKGNAK